MTAATVADDEVVVAADGEMSGSSSTGAGRSSFLSSSSTFVRCSTLDCCCCCPAGSLTTRPTGCTRISPLLSSSTRRLPSSASLPPTNRLSLRLPARLLASIRSTSPSPLSTSFATADVSTRRLLCLGDTTVCERCSGGSDTAPVTCDTVAVAVAAGDGTDGRCCEASR